MGVLQWAVDTADELISEFGKPVTFYREVAAAPSDIEKPWNPGPSPQLLLLSMR